MFANCSCICILSIPCMQAAPFCKSECYLIVPNGLHFSMNHLHGILTQGDLLLHSQVASQPTKPWKFDDLMILWVSVPKNRIPMESYGYLSKIIKNIGKTWEDYHILSVIRIQVLSPILFGEFLGKVLAFSASSFSKVKLSGWVGGEHYLQQLRHKSHMFMCW